MAFNVTGLTGFVDQTSFGLISQAVLGAHIFDYAQVRDGLSAGTIQVNILKSQPVFAAADCGWNAGGTTQFTKVNLPIADKQIKEDLCLETLRATWVSSELSSSGQLEDLPFADQIGLLKAKQISKYVEQVVFQGDSGVVTGLIGSVTTGAGAALQTVATGGLTAANWTTTNALAQAQALATAIPTEMSDREDLVMYMSFPNYRALTMNLATANLYHYIPGASTGTTLGDQFTIIPGTNVKAVPFSGMGTSQNVFAGPAEYIIIGTGLASDNGDDYMKIWYSQDNDINRFMAKFRIGVAVAFPEYFATNGLA